MSLLLFLFETGVNALWAYRFGQDPWYRNGFVPTVKQLVERITTGS